MLIEGVVDISSRTGLSISCITYIPRVIISPDILGSVGTPSDLVEGELGVTSVVADIVSIMNGAKGESSIASVL
jgi:hypothetical protein